MKSAVIHSRIESEIKEKAERILRRLGMTPTEAIRMFYTLITLNDGLPFPARIPNERTERTLRESREGRNLESFKSLDDLFKSWES